MQFDRTVSLDASKGWDVSKSRHNVTPTVKISPRYVEAAQDNNLAALKNRYSLYFFGPRTELAKLSEGASPN